jgi:RNA polymerase sigma-70 factor (ECF subfamily)
VSFEEKEPMIAGPETLLAGQTEIAAAFQNLPAQFRTILSLRHLQELSYQEIADLLQLPLGTVKTHLRRGRAALKKELEKLRREESPPLRGYKEA